MINSVRFCSPERLGRYRTRLRSAEWRRYGCLLFIGKLLGIAATFASIYVCTSLIGTEAFAEDPVVKANDIINPINTLWVLIAAFLVFAMQTGFMMLEAGLCRARETVNVLMECIVDTCLCGLLFYAVGFAFMFSRGNGFIGQEWFFLQGVPTTYESTGVAFMAYWLFQFAFADTCSTITSGAMIGRTGFVGDLLYSLGVSGFIYPIVGHWVWGPDGFLVTMGTEGHFLPSVGAGFHDFAGSTVVHSIGGVIALAGALALGPRLGRRFARDGGAPMPAHDLAIAASGGLILWFGWYGFNPGSTLSAMDYVGCGRVATNTTLAACAGGLVAMFYAYPARRKWELGATVNGFLGGLVAITCPCYWVSPLGSILIGASAGVVVMAATALLEHLRIDDPIGAVPVHGACGIWGTWCLGLFASGQYGVSGPFGADVSAPLTGLFYGGGTALLEAQVIGNAIVVAAAFGSSMLLMRMVKATKTLRVPQEAEVIGLDVYEHGSPVYPEFVLSTSEERRVMAAVVPLRNGGTAGSARKKDKDEHAATQAAS